MASNGPLGLVINGGKAGTTNGTTNGNHKKADLGPGIPLALTIDNRTGGVVFDLPNDGAGPNSGRGEVLSLASLTSMSVAPDAQLDGMTVILHKELPKISVDRYYQTFWAGENKAFYADWLKSQGKKNVVVESWKRASDFGGQDIVNDYDLETYEEKRKVSYSYISSTSMYRGNVKVEMTQYARRIKRTRCVVSSTIEIRGMPYSSAFRVHMRWVASRRTKVNLRLQIGVVVVFLEQVLVANQITDNTTQEMTEEQLSLFRHIKKSLGVSDKNMKDRQVAKKERSVLEKLWFSIFFPLLNVPENDVERKYSEAWVKLARCRGLKEKEVEDEREEQREFLFDEMDDVHASLDAILLRKLAYRDKSPPRRLKSDIEKLQLPKFLEPAAVQGVQIWNHLQVNKEQYLRSKYPRTIRFRNPQIFDKEDDAAYSNRRKDEVLSKMNVIVSSNLRDVKMRDFANIFLSDKAAKKGGLYEKWLRDTDRFDIEISKWQTEDDAEELIVDDYSGESFPQRRTVKATFDKSKFLRDPTTPSAQAQMTQEQYLRVSDEQFIWATTTTMENVPFANAYEVHIRWVVSKTSKKQISVKVGMFVVFKKTALLESKIQAGAYKESRRLQLDLFLKARSALGVFVQEKSEEQQKMISDSLTPPPRVVDALPNILPQLPDGVCKPAEMFNTVEADQQLFDEFENAKIKMRAVELYMKESDDRDDFESLKFMLAELNVVNDALDHIIEWHTDRDDYMLDLSEAGFP